ncbi:hypothetical protein L208DRAFT_1407059 [Tricholoma matsutake]|nr:hypothetical protein L208DRAFT_1407059 [Tricholoma matsutake 945]
MDCDSILLDVLIKQQKSGLQTSNGNFHTSAWMEAEKALAKTEMHTGGAPKSVSCCQNCWAALKKDYASVKKLKEMSGFGWDDTKRAVTAPNEVWDKLLEKHPKLGKWRSKGFPLFDDMADLVDGTYTTGTNVYHPGHDNTPKKSDSGSSDDDGQPSTQSIDPTLTNNSESNTSSASIETSISTPTTASSPIPTFLSHKCQAVQSNTTERPPPSACKQSSSQAITSVAAAMTPLAGAMAADTVVPSPECKRKAIEVIEDDGDLLENEMNKVYKIVCRDTAFADTVLAIDKQTACTSFIQSEINDSD